jgi:hypothetical protein
MLLDDLIPEVSTYLSSLSDTDSIPWKSEYPLEILPLAQYEYKRNYLVRQNAGNWVLCVNS